MTCVELISQPHSFPGVFLLSSKIQEFVNFCFYFLGGAGSFFFFCFRSGPMEPRYPVFSYYLTLDLVFRPELDYQLQHG